MKHLVKGRRFGRPADQRKALLRNLMKSFFTNNGKIKTTLARAKELRPKIEKVITRAKKNDTVAGRREVYKVISSHKLVKKIFEEIAPKFMERNGGYSRIYKLGKRKGDAAEMAMLTLLEEDMKTSEKQ